MAPISPEWSWRQTETTVTVDVKAKGVAKRNCDIFLSDYFMKVSERKEHNTTPRQRRETHRE